MIARVAPSFPVVRELASPRSLHVYARSRRGPQVYVASVRRGHPSCTCPGFSRWGYCRHVDYALRRWTSVRLEEFVEEGTREFPSPVKALDYLFGGPAFTSDEIFGLYGMPQTGKTLLALQTAYFLAAKGYNVLYITTEGGLASFARTWLPRFRDRYGDPEGAILVEARRGLEPLLEYLGYVNPRVVVKGDKYEFTFDGVKMKSQLEADIEKNKIAFLVLDSVTAPLRVFPPRQQNYPARASAVASILSKLEYVQGKYLVGVLTTHHASANPANPYDIWEKVYGGMALKYYVKRFVGVKPGNKQNPDIRKFWLLRGEGDRMLSKVSIARITGRGYEDVPEEEWYRYLTPAEARAAMNIRRPARR